MWWWYSSEKNVFFFPKDCAESIIIHELYHFICANSTVFKENIETHMNKERENIIDIINKSKEIQLIQWYQDPRIALYWLSPNITKRQTITDSLNKYLQREHQIHNLY